MNKYQRIIIVVSVALFSLLALLAAIITDLYDQDFPQAIGTEGRLQINFNESGLTINEAFLKLEELDLELGLGLIKIAPDLTQNGEGKIFAMLNHQELPDEFNWFGGGETGKVVNKDRLNNSYPDGVYLTTGNINHLEEFEETLKSIGIEVSRSNASIVNSLVFVVMERGFTAVILAALALISSLALFWFSVRAKGRALRVLGGAPSVRIQIQDLTAFGGALFMAAGIVTIVTAIYVGIFHGWVFIGTILKMLLMLQLVVICISIFVSLMISVLVWPSAVMLATRQPAVKRLRSMAIVIQVLTFILVVASTSPAWIAYKHSSEKAAETDKWKQLADQVSIVFATDNDAMNYMEPLIGDMIKEAELIGDAALSYTYTKEMWPAVDFGDFSAVSFVNERWLELVTKDEQGPVVTPISQHENSGNLVNEIREEVEILSRGKYHDSQFEQLQFLQPNKGFPLPVIKGGEDLQFGDDILLVVVQSLYETFNDSTLTSMISGGYITFTGVTATQQLIKQHGLDLQSLREQAIQGELKVTYISEEGILQAQFAAYLVWLRILSLIALVVAFSVATAISALIHATLQTKRDFPLRLSGRSWIQILQKRVVKELLIGAILVIIIIIWQRPEQAGVICITAAYGIFIVPLSHLLAVKWCFDGVSKRRS